MATPDSTQRFSDRVEDYVRYRPGYPDELLEVLRAEAGLGPTSVVADVGSGTGISTEMLLRVAAVVHAVEPNAEMRAAAERMLGSLPGFRSISGRAEGTGLPDGNVDLVTAGQAFHWFEPKSARIEFARILRRPARVALFWNERSEEATPFLVAYEQLLKEFGTDYLQTRHRDIQAPQLQDFFQSDYRSFEFPNQQRFDFEGLRGRLLSSSYTPPQSHPRHEPMLRRLREIYDAHQEGGMVQFVYMTSLHVGELG